MTQSWLEAGEELEVLRTDAEDKPHLAEGRNKGIAVAQEGGLVRIVLDSDGEEVGLYPEDVVGMKRG